MKIEKEVTKSFVGISQRANSAPVPAQSIVYNYKQYRELLRVPKVLDKLFVKKLEEN